VAGRVLPAARPELGERVQPELYRSMVEMNTPVCSTLAEVRVADVCKGVEEAVMVAGLVRALAFTCHAAAVRGDPDSRPRPELLSAAKWRASRHGLEADLVDVVGGRALPAAELVRVFLAAIRPGLEAGGDVEEVTGLVEATIARGTGAARQRQEFRRSGRLEQVVDMVVTESAR
jgi:glutamate---cysteine ligase / carboxylate-amine ligase